MTQKQTIIKAVTTHFRLLATGFQISEQIEYVNDKNKLPKNTVSLHYYHDHCTFIDYSVGNILFVIV